MKDTKIINAKTAYQKSFFNNMTKQKIADQLNDIMLGINHSVQHGEFGFIYKKTQLGEEIFPENITILKNLGYKIEKVNPYKNAPEGLFYYIISWDKDSAIKTISISRK